MHIRIDDLRGPEIRALLEEHLVDMHRISPPESVHALDLEGLRKPEITFWTAWSGSDLVGCGALKALDTAHGEIKSMRTSLTHRRTGAGRAMLHHILDEARRRGYTRLSLETGSQPAFEPARRLYSSFGFEVCGPFATYAEDPLSVFMTRTLREPQIVIRGLDHLVLRVVDLDAMLRFYCEALGCRLEKRQDAIGLVQLRAGSALIDLVPVDGPLGRAGGAAPGREGRNLDHFCLAVEPFDETAIRAQLKAHGIEAGPVQSRYGAQGEGPSIYLTDPEGNVIELKGPPAATP